MDLAGAPEISLRVQTPGFPASYAAEWKTYICRFVLAAEIDESNNVNR